ncbi:MAG: hypothetical protein LLG20_25855 [Acidobacteriales bacterium]|nr:hypothetical protein [Terriglobales bacterium]
MFSKWQLSVLPFSLALLVAGDQTWKDKRVAEWSEDDAKQVLTDSPWVKTVQPTMAKSANNGEHRRGGGMGRGGGIGIGGIGIGLPGMGGMGRRGGMGGPGGGYPGGGGGYPDDRQGRRGDDGTGAGRGEPPSLKLRWESALPVREAELKARETNAPTVDADHYAIAVYGAPNRIVRGDSKDLVNELKKQAAIKREGKKDLKPSSVQVLQRDDGPVIVYLFPRSTEITRQDKRLDFDGQIGRFKFEQSFYVEDMTYQGKLEL